MDDKKPSITMDILHKTIRILLILGFYGNNVL